ncbi:MAG TPA: nucleoside triphosphate pyrophosphohydrolase [Candidatus Dormibacteraeota bacterium]|nr:nucleoside triphosphate pyrophosphohydrolase [Candidatus Dormibacteraeota bacterium]
MPERPYPDGVEAIFHIARRLRAPDGCPWDREQTHESLRPYLLEEAHETLEVIDRGQDDAKLMEELGDVLLQVAMHSAIAEEEGRFDAARLSEAAAAKMVARHPHVFGDEEVADAAGVLRMWERRKAEEAAAAGREAETPLDRVPSSMPALAWTSGMQKRAARVGFDLDPEEGAVEAIAAGASRLAAAETPDAAFREAGELLLAVVGLARRRDVNPEDALRTAGHRYRDRFAAMDRELRARGARYEDLDAEEREALWRATAG